MLTGRNEWIAIAALILYIAFIPCPGVMTAFFSSSIGKMVALGVIVYVLKYVSIPVAILMLVAVDRKGALREYMEDMTPPASEGNNFKCPSEFIYDAGKKKCTKGMETKDPECNDSSMTWDAASGMCKSTTTSTSTETPPGSMAAMADMKKTEQFTGYSKEKEKFAPV